MGDDDLHLPAVVARVREARPEDARALAEVHVDAWRAAYGEMLEGSFLARLSVEEREQTWSERLAIPHGLDHFSLIAEGTRDQDGSALLGFVTGGGSRDEDRRGFGEIYSLYVAPRQLRQGIGRTLITTGTAQLSEGRFSAATLWVAELNFSARAFYEELGWSGDGTSRLITVGGTTLVELRYALDL